MGKIFTDQSPNPGIDNGSREKYFSEIFVGMTETNVRVNLKGMQKYILFFVTSLSIHQAAEAQQGDGFPFKGAELTAIYGIHFVQNKSFNKSLQSIHLPPVESTLNSLGVGGGAFLNRFYFGGQATWQFGSAISNESYRTRLSGGNGLIKAGYTIVHNSFVALYPTLGLGGGGTSIRVSEGATDDGLSVLRPGDNLHSAYMLADLSLNADFFMPVNKENTSSLLLGFTAGYSLAPYIQAWEYGSEKTSELEKFAPEGFYLMFKVGWNRVE
jgi:hypothetical protein